MSLWVSNIEDGVVRVFESDGRDIAGYHMDFLSSGWKEFETKEDVIEAISEIEGLESVNFSMPYGTTKRIDLNINGFDVVDVSDQTLVAVLVLREIYKNLRVENKGGGEKASNHIIELVSNKIFKKYPCNMELRPLYLDNMKDEDLELFMKNREGYLEANGLSKHSKIFLSHVALNVAPTGESIIGIMDWSVGKDLTPVIMELKHISAAEDGEAKNDKTSE